MDPLARRKALQTALQQLASSKVKINAMTILAEEWGESRKKEFLSVLTSRLKAAEDLEKLPFWCLLDSLMKNVADMYREDVERHLPTLIHHIPWGVRDHVPLYMGMVMSWGAILPPAVMARIEEKMKESMLASKKRFVSKAPRQAEFCLRLRRANAAAAAEADVGVDVDQLLIPISTAHHDEDDVVEPDMPDQAVDDEEPPQQQPPQNRKATDEQQQAPEKALMAVNIPTVSEEERTEEFDPSVVERLYSRTTQCAVCGVRFPADFDIPSHKDHHYHMGTAEERYSKCRMWYVDEKQWEGIADTNWGLMAVHFRDKYINRQPFAGGAARKTPQSAPAPAKRPQLGEVLVEEAKGVTRCEVCNEQFETFIRDGDWVLSESVFGEVVDPKKPWQLKKVVLHQSCHQESLRKRRKL
eukprot:Sspe_Gene.100954::Locus_75595_Transcript_1_1_Confidence_1.000_Length_1342::g.100954::m.100954